MAGWSRLFGACNVIDHDGITAADDLERRASVFAVQERRASPLDLHLHSADSTSIVQDGSVVRVGLDGRGGRQLNAIAHLIGSLTVQAAEAAGAIVLRSASIFRDGRAVVLVGPSLSGKTTLALEAERRGWCIASTNYTVLAPCDGRVEITGGTSGLTHRPALSASRRRPSGDPYSYSAVAASIWRPWCHHCGDAGLGTRRTESHSRGISFPLSLNRHGQSRSCWRQGNALGTGIPKDWFRVTTCKGWVLLSTWLHSSAGNFA